MATSEDKWKLPGWKIEQKYSSGILIGNWSEDRLEFEKGSHKANSTNKETYKDYSSVHKPDVISRRSNLLVNVGLDKAHLFSHHGNLYSRYMISMYDQEYGQRRGQITGNRMWDKHRLSWAPEASDNPVSGEPKRWGLHESLKDKWKKLEELERLGDFVSTYHLGYNHGMLPQYPRRYATPRALSSHLHPQRINKDMNLRGMHSNVQPEHPISTHQRTYTT
ncbi:cilia- and flagella-associated protein 107-like [Dysidea avara]|uniref:cilia- and flagella-associated protein 107-like n=1 Tax=Dysidea avara TaxID=196820 RepID=UPI003328FCF2